jgi:hypothetical protein
MPAREAFEAQLCAMAWCATTRRCSFVSGTPMAVLLTSFWLDFADGRHLSPGSTM